MIHPSIQMTPYVVSGICCSTEETILRKKMDALAGPGGYLFNSLTGVLAVNSTVEGGLVIKEVADAGFGIRRRRESAAHQTFWDRHGIALLAGVGSILCLTGMLLEYRGGVSVVGRVLLLAGMGLSGWKIVQKAFAAVRSGSLEMNTLVTLAAVGALFIDRWAEAAAVLVLFSLSLLIESYSARRTRHAIQSLMSNAPSEAHVVRNGVEQVTAAAMIAPGENIIIRPGERIPLDGVVESGESLVNQSAITGESGHVEKTRNDVVYAGSLNEHGTLTVKVTKRFEETTLARIVELVENAQSQRAQVQQTVDKFASIYTPAVVCVSVLVAGIPPLMFHQPFMEWVYRALVLLVIACPCALVISTPVALVSAITVAARHGILVKGGRNIETLSRVTTMAFDKTGTLTEGKPAVTDIVMLDSLSREKILGIVAALEKCSEHHLAAGVLAEAERASVEQATVDGFAAIPGKGVRGRVGDTLYYFGNRRLSEERGYCSAEVEQHLLRLGSEGKTVMILGKEQEALAVIAVNDGIRTQSLTVVDDLRSSGIHNIVMITGDDEKTARRIAVEAGIDQVHAGLLPGDKVAVIEQLKQFNGTVAMVGDGINDAPALAASSVGIAMGVAGTDVVLEAADVTLMSDNLAKLPFLFKLSRKAIFIVKQNIALALGLKLVFLIFTLAGISTLWMAVLADDGAALLVIFNGLRLLSFKN